jgi:DNA-binding MurR/RpiR family transcriptional regulator
MPTTLRAEIEARQQNQRPTPAHRRIVQVLLDHANEIGFLSSMELAALANVSQPSVTRFAAALGFDGFADMRRRFRAVAEPTPTQPNGRSNRYQSAVEAEEKNLRELCESLADLESIRSFGKALASSRPLVVLGLRASAGLATQFAYFAAKVHHDVRLITGGGSLLEDQLEQAQAAGATTVLAFGMPLYPRELIRGLQHAKQIGLRVAVVSDPAFQGQGDLADMILTARINSSLVFDSSAGSAVLVSVLLDAMCDATRHAEARLEQNERSSARRKVFAR